MGRSDWDRLMEEAGSKNDFSGVIYMKKENEIVGEAAYGYANRSEKLPNTIHTRFGIASGCKLFTAIGICQLVEKGLLSFQSKLHDCLDIDFPHFDRNITIHHLLSHTSGIPDYYDEELMDDFEALWQERPVYTMRSSRDFLPLFKNNQMKFNPGEKFHYNNAGFILLGLVIEEQTGKKFTDFIETEVFQQCGMKDSGYFPMDHLPSNTALGYIDDEKGETWRTNIYSIPAIGGADGGAFSTAPDMIKLWEALFSYQLVNREITQMLLTPQVCVKDDVHYGYGLWINKKKEDIFKYHVMGYDPGVSFHSAVYPALDIKMAITSNEETGPYDIMKTIEDHF